jgi:hypothetical protein
LQLLDCKFARHIAGLWSGGAIYVYEGATVDADRCYFVGNEARAAALSTSVPASAARSG